MNFLLDRGQVKRRRVLRLMKILMEQVRDVLLQLQPGQYSEPFRSSHGWHIVQLEERRKQQSTDENLKNRAYQMIYNRRFAEEVQVWLDELRDEAYINIISGQKN